MSVCVCVFRRGGGGQIEEGCVCVCVCVVVGGSGVDGGVSFILTPSVN